MSENIGTETLEREVNNFADSLPYWSKYLASLILSGNTVSEPEIEIAYNYLLEDLGVKKTASRSEITIGSTAFNSGNCIPDLLLSRIESVEGVNALVEGQVFDFNPNLTIVFGANGSGKSGYIRLLKKAFYSKSPEEIIPNIHIENGHKPINASFTFTNTGDMAQSLRYSEKGGAAEFEHFAVFDGKSVVSHLEQKNEFEFRPAGLSFFSEFNDTVKMVEERLNEEIKEKTTENTFYLWFEKDSEIKEFVGNLSADTKIEELSKYKPYTEEDKNNKIEIEKQYDELLISTKDKDRQLKSLKDIRNLLEEKKKNIEELNRYFSSENLNRVKKAVEDCIQNEASAKADGIENFKTDKIEGIGSTEWKNFIVAADSFAKKQIHEKEAYPQENDNCLLCQQPLTDESVKLISNYWKYIRSVAEETAKKSRETLNNLKSNYEKLKFDLFPDENILTVWLKENRPEFLEKMKGMISEQKTITEHIISDIISKSSNTRMGNKIPVDGYDDIIASIDTSMQSLENDEHNKELERLLKLKIFLEHKEKFNIHFSSFETYVGDLKWIKKAASANFGKRKITSTEKSLSDKYFNQKYVELFNRECDKLNGNFGIEINHTGSAGKSYRQLKLKGRNPNTVLSEGEKKVIAIADFITEMQLSEINRGIIFDDPVSSLDDKRKGDIARRLVEGSRKKQTIIFTHDLVFVSSLIGYCTDFKVNHSCHWIENKDGKPGQVWLNNSPSYEQMYRSAEPAKKYYVEAKKEECPPATREGLLKSGFAALRTSYEVMVINDLFKNVVQRFNERVSVDSLSKVYFNTEIVEEIQDSFGLCCRFMEGHAHSDKYAYKKPDLSNLNEEIQRFENLRSKIKKLKKPA